MAKLCIYKSSYSNILFISKNKLIEALIKSSGTFIPIFIVSCTLTSNLA